MKIRFERKVEIAGFPLQGKPLFLQIYRRKWKETGKKKSYTNTYEFYRPGMKTTDEFGIFLKELTRQERHEFLCAFGYIQYTREEDLQMV